MSITRFPHGLSSFGIPVLGSGDIVTTGNVFFVDDSGSDDSALGRDPDRPFATIDYAIGQCTAGQCDTIVVMPGHAETASTYITCDVAGIRIIGLGFGQNRPTVTAYAGAVDCFNVTADDVTIQNIRIVGATSCTALVNIAADDFTAINCVFEHGAAPLNAVTVASGARASFHGCKWYGTADGPDYGILFESASENASKDFEVIDCLFNYGLYGLDNAAISNASNGTVEGGIIRNCVFSGMAATAIDFNSSSSASVRGIIADCVATGYGSLTIANIYDLSSYGALNCDATDDVSKGTGGPYSRIPGGTAA